MESSSSVVPLSVVVRRVVERAYSGIQELTRNLSRRQVSDSERKGDLLKYLVQTREQLRRLYIVVKWAANASQVHQCQEILRFLEQQGSYLTEAADSLFMVHSSCQNFKTPDYNIATALEVLTTGSYRRFPSAIETTYLPKPPLPEEEKKVLLDKLEDVTRLKLLECQIPERMSSITIDEGKVTLCCPKEFEVQLMLGGEGVASWRLLEIHILVRPDKDVVETVHPNQLYSLQSLVQHRLNSASEPLVEVYRILHRFCVNMQLSLLHSQLVSLGKSRWEGFLSHTSYDDDAKQLQICYWQLSNPNTISADASVDSIIGGCIRVYVSTDGDLCIRHLPRLIDESGVELTLTLDSEWLSIEALFLAVVAARKRLRLKFLYKAILGQLPPSLSPTDVSYAADNPNSFFLSITILDSWQIKITVDTFNGSFILFDGGLLDKDTLNRFQHDLNKSVEQLGDLLSRMRHAGLVALLCSEASRLGLEPFKRLSLFIDDSLKTDSDAVYLRFPGQDSFLRISIAQGNILLYSLVITSLRKSDGLPQAQQIVPLHLDAMHSSSSSSSSSSFSSASASSLSAHSAIDIDQSAATYVNELDLSISSHVNHVLPMLVERCRAHNQLLLLSKQLSEQHISSRLVGEKLRFQAPCEPLQCQHFELTVTKQGGIEAVLSQSNPLFICRERGVDVVGDEVIDFCSNSNLQLVYDPVSYRLTFRYSSVHANSIHTMLADVKRVARMTKINRALRSVLESDSYPEVQILQLRYLHSVFTFTQGPFELGLSISPNILKGFQLEICPFSFPVTTALEMMLAATENVFVLIEILRAGCVLYLELGALVDGRGMSGVPEGDMTLIPRSPTHVRLVYQQRYAVDFRLLQNNTFSVEDASAGIAVAPSNSIYATEIPMFQNLYSVPGSDVYMKKETTTFAVEDLGLLAPSYKQFGEIHYDSPAHVSTCLRHIYHYLGVTSLFHQINEVVKSNPTLFQKYIYKPDLLSLHFELPLFFARFSIEKNPNVHKSSLPNGTAQELISTEMKLENGNHDSTHLGSGSPSRNRYEDMNFILVCRLEVNKTGNPNDMFSAEEVGHLVWYFHSRVCIAPFRRQLVNSFFDLFSLPPPILKEVAMIMAKEREQASIVLFEAESKVELLLASLNFSKESFELRTSIRFWRRNEFADVAVTYHLQQKTVQVNTITDMSSHLSLGSGTPLFSSIQALSGQDLVLLNKVSTL